MELEDLYLLKGKTFALDTETNGVQYWNHDPIGISIHCPELGISDYIQTCIYDELEIPLKRTKKTWTGAYTYSDGKKQKVYTLEQAVKYVPSAIPIKELRPLASEILQDIANDPNTCMIMHNSKFDCHMLDLDLLNKPCKLMDTSVMVHLYDSRLRKSLDDCERKFLGRNTKRNHVLAAPKNLGKKVWLWPEDITKEYAINDAIVTYQLAETLMPKLRKLKLIELFANEMEYSKTLWQIERRGISRDVELCNNSRKAFSDNLLLMEQEMYDTIGYKFNWRSNPQLSKAIYEDFNFPRPVNPFASADGIDHSKFALKGKYNKYATSTFLLMEKSRHPLGGLILDLREGSKLRKTVDSYIELADKDGIIHTNFNTVRTRTGRLSSTKPNLQNIASEHRVRETQSTYSGGAIRSGEYNLRMIFKSRPGYSFVSIDHAQQEQRLFAIIANEPVMLEALRNRLDIHLMIAIAVWGDCGPEKNKLHREWSKTISFGLLYGMTAGSLKYRLNKEADEAKEITDKYWGTFPRVQPWLTETVEKMHKLNRVRYWSGRIWREEDKEYYYRACNAQIQGGAADLIKLAVMRASRACSHMGWGNVCSIIHDEILCEIKDEYVTEATPVLVRIMELEDIFGLPFKAEAKVGKSYGSFKDFSLPPVSDIVWQNYLPADTDFSALTLTPWKDLYGEE